MPRIITQGYRDSVEAFATADSDRIFMTIYHPTLAEPIRVVNDNVKYSFQGYTWDWFPFKISLLSDDESPPQAKLTINNVSTKIGKTVRILRRAPRLRIELYGSFEFTDTGDPRTAIGTPTAQYVADFLFLTGISVNQLQVSASIVGWDYTQKVYPGVRASQDRTPGLFR